jgi:signal transduction histidine kinase
MIEEKQTPERAPDDGEVVYRRISVSEEDAGAPGGKKDRRGRSPQERQIAPTLKPLVIGFALLLALVIVLGHLSVRRLEDVSSQVINREAEYAAKLDLLLKLRLALTRLDTEARTRAQAKARNEIMPPGRLYTARNEVIELLPTIDRAPFAQTEKWRTLRKNLDQYLPLTEDLDAYNARGFPLFRDVDLALNEMLQGMTGEQNEILRQSEALRDSAAHRIYLWTVIALLTGALVVATTIWEVQRRFRQMQQSLELARRERQFSTQMLEGMVSAVVAVDARDHIRSANNAFFEIFPQSSIGASIHDKFASPEAMKMLEAATAAHGERASYRGRWLLDTHATPDASKRTFDVYSSPLSMNGERGQIVTLVDATEAAEAENVLRRTESLAAVGQAAAQVAHEIKNPLGSIRLGVSMLRDMTKDEEALSTIDLVDRGIDHLNKLAGDVTQFSRQKPLTRSDIDLHQLLNESLELVADRIQEKRTPVEKQFDDASLHGQWDADQLRQVFVNLLANALDASPENSPVRIITERVSAEAASASRGNGTRGQMGQRPFARITIIDEGDGMDEETRARIFEPFFTTKKRGTGLGLAIVKQIVEQHDGAISVESSPGKGTRFTVDLPV